MASLCEPMRGLQPPPALDWNAGALAAALAPLWPGVGIEVVATAESTNSALLARGRSAATAITAPQVLVAEQQTAGRGRLGRAWQSQPGASLTFSVALPFAPADWSGLSLAVGVALAEALDGGASATTAIGEPPRGIRLKWPNDLWLAAAAGQPAAAGRKLGGILIETVMAGGRRLAVIGIGLNVSPFSPPGPLPPDRRMAFLSEIDRQADPPGTLARLLPSLARALRRFERDGFAAFAARFAARDALRGLPASAGAEHGIVEGVGATGALRLRTPAGVRELLAGDVSLQLEPPAAEAGG